MSVISVKPMPDNQGGSQSDEGGHYELGFIVRTSSADDGQIAVTLAIGDPNLNAAPVVLGQTYSWRNESDPSSICREIAPKRRGDKVWEAICSFRPLDDADRQSGNKPDEPDPFLEPPEISWGRDDVEEAVWKAYRRQDEGDGTWTKKPVGIVNSAGGMYAQPILRKRRKSILHIARNESVFPQGWVLLFEDALNSHAFLGWPPYTVLCRSITGTWQCKNVSREIADAHDPPSGFPRQRGASWWIYYWRVAYDFSFDRRGWLDELLDTGAFYRDTRPSIDGNPNPNFNKLSAVRDKGGIPMHGPFLLDGRGGLLDDSKAMAGDVVHRVYAHRDAADFAPMKISLPY